LRVEPSSEGYDGRGAEDVRVQKAERAGDIRVQEAGRAKDVGVQMAEDVGVLEAEVPRGRGSRCPSGWLDLGCPPAELAGLVGLSSGESRAVIGRVRWKSAPWTYESRRREWCGGRGNPQKAFVATSRQ
jgi:hypothetical protein